MCRKLLTGVDPPCGLADGQVGAHDNTEAIIRVMNEAGIAAKAFRTDGGNEK
ncbi:hypothetical protein DSC_07735 [Pseudoxanthomonas spadix BD-a59]|uniref:Uncharacterized protein n=1 Tax=Pseudoxanthomonas spadix (strain BD-a59) TaxID=1045855 RepID=G7UTU5_PSEUP|nr:hypothetical protein DSC_07735 [Pseudoxanthomonas spadix BD-a59]